MGEWESEFGSAKLVIELYNLQYNMQYNKQIKLWWNQSPMPNTIPNSIRKSKKWIEMI